MIPAELEQIQQRLEAAEKKLQLAEARCTALMAQRECLQRQVDERRRHSFLFVYRLVCNHEDRNRNGVVTL